MRRIFAAVALSMMVGRAWATPRYFLFWYPGGAGDAVQAQPLLDQFAALLNAKTPGTTWRAIYIPVEDKGISFITGPRPAFGIVSHLMYWKHGAALQMTPIAATRPLPHGATSEPLTLVSGPCTTTAGGPAAKLLYGSEPFTLDYLRTAFGESAADHFRPWPSGVVSETKEMFKILQNIGATGACDMAVLTAAESAALKVLKAPWIAQLKTVAISPPIATPVVARFGAPAMDQAMRDTLLTLHREPAARAILRELRLAGFAPWPDAADRSGP